MLGRSKVKPGAARAKYRGMAMAQRYRGAKTSAKQPATSTVAAKTTPSSVNAKKPSSSGIVSSSKEAVKKMPPGPRTPVRFAEEPVPSIKSSSATPPKSGFGEPEFMSPKGISAPYQGNGALQKFISTLLPSSAQTTSSKYNAIKSAAMSGAGNLNPDDSPKMPPRPVERRPIGFVEEAVPMGMKKGGSVKTFKKGGSVDGCAQRGKTKGRYI